MCSHDLPQTYDSCQPPLPWPFYWVQDNYLGTQVFFDQKEEAEVYMNEYTAKIQTSVDSLFVTIQMDKNSLADFLEFLLLAFPKYCG